MSKELRDRIDQFNQIEYKDNFDKRIIICTLKPAIDYTIVWKDGTKTFQNQDGTVTTAPKYKE